MASTGNDATPPPDATRLLELSDERDQWERLAREMWLDGYAAGHAGGHREGYEQAVREWKVTAAGLGHLLGGMQWEELDRRRYPPGGRQSWIIPASDREGAA